jgi:plasmid replication initiation protein
MKLVDLEKNKIVKKHNDIIKAKGGLSSTSQKMLSMIISMIKTDDTEFQKYALSLDAYKKEIGSTHRGKEEYVTQALELMSNPFYVLEDGKRKFFNWCSVVEPDVIEGHIVFKIDSELKPFLLQMKNNFTQYHLINILKLKGDYTPRLYEYCIFRYKIYIKKYQEQYNKTPKSFKFSMTLDSLKEQVGLIWYDNKKKKHEKTYKYNDIKRRILEVAKRQFKEHTDITFDYEERKLGRKIESIIITIGNNDKGSNCILTNVSHFVEAVKEQYQGNVQEDYFPTLLGHSTRDIQVRVNSKTQDLYIMFENKTINLIGNQSIKIFNILYEYAKTNNITALDEISLLLNEEVDLLLEGFCNIKRNTLFSEDELKSKFDEFIGLTFLVQDDECKVLNVSELKGSDYLNVLIYNDFTVGKQELKMTLEELKKLYKNIKKV